MLNKFHFFVFALCAFFSTEEFSIAEPEKPHTAVELIAEVTEVKPGEPFWVALRFQMDPGWHIYWRNPGDSGLAPEVTWQLPEGWRAGEIQWPYPKQIDEAGLATYVYEGQVGLLAQIHPSAVIPSGTEVTLAASLQWLECEQICVPGQAKVSLALPVTSDQPFLDRRWIKFFAQTRDRLPQKDIPWMLQVLEEGKHFEIRLTLPPMATAKFIEARFFPYRNDLIDHAAIQSGHTLANTFSLRVAKSSLRQGEIDRIQGVLFLKPDENSSLALEIDTNLGAMQIPEELPVFAQEERREGSTSVVLLLLFAFLGGLILNLMPCVLPVLSLKVLNLVAQSQQEGRKIWQHGLLYAAGVVMSFWILAGIMLVLRAGGEQIGWGFQFQSPVFVIVLSVVFLVLALNLFGVFEIGTSLTTLSGSFQHRHRWLDSFLIGVLATVAATPCTAPFMGVAIGVALTQPAAVVLLIFTFLGLGLALPFLIFSCFPSLLRFLPKPGLWMVNLKRFFGILLLLTVAWLWWVLWLQVRSPAPMPEQNVTKNTKSILPWQAFRPTIVQDLRDKGRPVFVDFTAAWCLTCQVNERLILNSPSVIAAFQKKNVALVKADWTRHDEMITQALAEFGKNSIPFYVLYPADVSQKPIILPEILTRQMVINALKQLEDKNE